MKSFIIFNDKLKLYYIHQFASDKSIEQMCSELSNSKNNEDPFFEELINSSYQTDFIFTDVNNNKETRVEIIRRKYEGDGYTICGKNVVIRKTETQYPKDAVKLKRYKLQSTFIFGDVLIQFIVWLVLIFISLGLMLPFFIYFMLKFMINTIEIVEIKEDHTSSC